MLAAVQVMMLIAGTASLCCSLIGLLARGQRTAAVVGTAAMGLMMAAMYDHVTGFLGGTALVWAALLVGAALPVAAVAARERGRGAGPPADDLMSVHRSITLVVTAVLLVRLEATHAGHGTGQSSSHLHEGGLNTVLLVLCLGGYAALSTLAAVRCLARGRRVDGRRWRGREGAATLSGAALQGTETTLGGASVLLMAAMLV